MGRALSRKYRYAPSNKTACRVGTSFIAAGSTYFQELLSVERLQILMETSILCGSALYPITCAQMLFLTLERAISQYMCRSCNVQPKMAFPHKQICTSHVDAHIARACPGINTGPPRTGLRSVNSRICHQEKFGLPMARTDFGWFYRKVKHVPSWWQVAYKVDACLLGADFIWSTYTSDRFPFAANSFPDQWESPL